MKKSRAPNFTNAEIMHLLNLVEKYPIIENKRTDGATTKEKQMAWQNLADEYNSQTKFSPRTAEKLLSCYKNQKIKVKKMHSNEKMLIKAPLLLNAVEKHGQDWGQIARETGESSFSCEETFKQLVKAAKKDDSLQKKEINRTGGGPPPPSSSSDPMIDKVKTLIDPSLEGLYTIYDGDAEFMQEQQILVKDDARLQPIESLIIDDISPHTKNDPTQDHNINAGENSSAGSDFKRLNVIKRKVDPSLLTRTGKKKQVSNSFQELAEDKKCLVSAQKTLAEYQIQHQQLLIELAKEKLVHEKKKNEMELKILTQKYELELDLLRNKKMCD